MLPLRRKLYHAVKEPSQVIFIVTLAVVMIKMVFNRYFLSDITTSYPKKDILKAGHSQSNAAIGRVERKKNYLSDYKIGYITSPEMTCSQPNDFLMLILVTSGIAHGERRHAIRETWGSTANLKPHDAKILFLLADFPPEKQDKVLASALQQEQELHQDILRFTFEDSYLNLTLKTLEGIKWASDHCSQASFVMKTDDDIYVNVPLLADFLTRQKVTEKGASSIFGCIKNKQVAERNPLSMGGAVFPTVHPLFTAGAGYVISKELLRPLYKASLTRPLIRVEDAFLTGYLAESLGYVYKQDNPAFSCGQLVESSCSMANRFTGHKVTPDKMKEIHQALKHKLCDS